jgi:hypothetical protein
MNLAEYIKDVGHEEAAKLFGVSIFTVKSWRWGLRTPRPAKANEIVRLTGGAVSLAGIFATNDKNKAA